MPGGHYRNNSIPGLSLCTLQHTRACPGARSPLQHLPAATARKSSQLLPHCNGSSTGLPQLPGTPALTGHRNTQLQHNTSTGRTTAPPQLLDRSTKSLQRMLKAEACPLQRTAPNQELAQLPALQMPQGSKREMPKEFSPVSAAQMKGGNGSAGKAQPPRLEHRLLTLQHLAGCLPAPEPGSLQGITLDFASGLCLESTDLLGKKVSQKANCSQTPCSHPARALQALTCPSGLVLGLFFFVSQPSFFSQGSFIFFFCFPGLAFCFNLKLLCTFIYLSAGKNGNQLHKLKR